MDLRKEVQKDPVTKHKQQSLWLIYLPLALIALVVGAIGLYFILNSTSGGSLTITWSSIALIFLIGPIAFSGIITLVILILAVIGLEKTSKAVTPRLRAFRINLLRINTQARAYANKSVSPLITGRSFISGFNALLNFGLRQNKNRRKK